VIKNKAYFKRFQVKYRRRREGKTDYYARKRLITQDKNKYGSPKYRFVVRTTNSDIITQIVAAKLDGDHILAAAYAHELPKYGVKTGLTNYASTYAVGLLCARRLLQKLKLDTHYAGNKTIDGQVFNVEEVADAPRPFTANLDIGLHRTTTGAKIFAALKGAVDGGLLIPHSEKRFPGYDAEAKKFDPEVLKKRIFGEHIAEYQKTLKADEPEEYKTLFSQYVKHGVEPAQIPEIYKKAHAAIRADPSFTKKVKKEIKKKHWGQKRRNIKQRKDRIKQILAAAQASKSS